MEPNQTPIQPIVFPVQPTTEPIQASAEQNFEPTKKSLPKWPLIIVGIILIATLLTGTYLLGKNQGINQKPASKTVQVTTPTVSLTPTSASNATDATPNANLKTYTNSKYGFQINYPATGKVVSMQNGIFSYNTGACGNAIKEFSDGVNFDSFFNLQVINWGKTIQDYIKSQEAENLFNITPITTANADEAFHLSLKDNWQALTTSPILPLQANNIYKKGSILVIMGQGQQQPTVGGCVPESSTFNQTFWANNNFKFANSNVQQVINYAGEGQSCGENAGAGGNAQCSPGLLCVNVNLTTKIGTCIKQ